jgi:large repetitive protein
MKKLGRHITRGAAILVIAGLIPLVAATPALAAHSNQKSIRINNASIVEGDTGHQNMAFTISWTGSKGGTAPTVQYTTANLGSTTGYATAGKDYTATSGTTPPMNGQCKCFTVNVPILGDTMTEPTETFAVNLSSPVGATIADAQGIGTIYDNEGPSSLVVTDVSGPEAAGTFTFAVELTHANATPVSVDYATADGTAIAGSDYTSTSGTLTFSPGLTSMSVPVTIDNDALAEDNETFTLHLSNATGGIAITDANGTGTIQNDDNDPTVSIANASVLEGDIGTTTLSLPVTLSGPSGREVDVDYATSDGTATAGSDYTATNGTIVFAAGETSKQIDVTVNGDIQVEGDETFTVTLSAPFNADLGSSVATGAITNDDNVGPKLVVSDAAGLEGNSGTTPIAFTVAMVPVSTSDVTVDYVTSNGTASAGSDYTAASGTLTIPAGQASGSIPVTVIGDKTYEPNETFTLTLSNPVGATVVADTAVGTIMNDDKIPTVLSLQLAKARTAIKAKGTIQAAISGMPIKVSLLHKVGRKYVVVSAKTVNATGLLDRNHDGILDAAYVASFKRPATGAYRFVVRYAGNATYAPSKRTLSFKL